MQDKNAKSFVDPEMTVRLDKAISENYKSKSDFAGVIGATYEVVRLWCLGKSKPNADFLREISKKTSISVDWLLSGKENNDVTADWSHDEKQACADVRKILNTGEPDDRLSILIEIRRTLKMIESKKEMATSRKSLKKKKLSGKRMVA